MATAYSTKMTARASAAAEPQREPVVDIVPTRRHIDDRFPVLGFTVRSGGLPYFEVLLAVDPKYFDPAHAAERTPSTFYASRQDSGLMRAPGPHAVYLVPPAVLRAFSEATPRPARIYYTAVCYQNESGGGPVFAHSPERLRSDAPYVTLAADFRGATLARVLGVALDKLQRVGGHNGAGAAPVLSAPPSTPSAIDDAAEGEDGYSAGAQAPAVSEASYGPAPAPAGSRKANGLPLVAMPPARAMQAEGSSEDEPGFEYDDGYEGAIDDSLAGSASGATASATAFSDLGSDDEEALGPGGQAGAQALETGHRGAGPPAALQEEDEHARWRAAAPGTASHGYGDEADAPPEAPEALEEFDLTYQSLEGVAPPAPTPPHPLTIETKRRMIETISGGGAEYGYTGQVGRPPGLLYGIGRFSQEDGSLGQVLGMMRDRDPAAFSAVFGEAAGELLATTNAPWPADGPPASASPRLTPVAGAQLWQEPWIGRFRQAAANPAFQAAQNEATARLYLDPMLGLCRQMGLTSERAVAMALAVAIELGAPGAIEWLAETAGPVRSPAIRQQALAALGHRDLAAFQSASGIEPDGRWNGATHAAMSAALRGLGSRSPVQAPRVDQMLDAVVQQAGGQPWAERLARLRRTPELRDAELQF